MYKKTRGIVLRKNKYTDNAAILTIFTRDLGVIKASAFGLHSLKNGIAGASQIYTFSEYTLVCKNDTYTVTNAMLVEDFGRITAASYEALLQAERVASAALVFFGEAQDSQDGFLLLYATMSYMAYSGMHPDDAYIYFLLHSFKLSGQCPAITHCAVCDEELFRKKDISFSYKHGGAVCSKCAVGAPVMRLSLEAMRRILLIPYIEMGKVVLPPNVRDELLMLLDGYYRYWNK